MTDNLSASLSPGDDERFHQFGRATTIILALILRSLIIGAEIRVGGMLCWRHAQSPTKLTIESLGIITVSELFSVSTKPTLYHGRFWTVTNQNRG